MAQWRWTTTTILLRLVPLTKNFHVRERFTIADGTAIEAPLLGC